MKLLDKLKDALFEEEEIEIDEREIKEKRVKEKNKKKKETKEQNDTSNLSKVKITSYEDEEELEKPIAKKIVNEKIEEKEEEVKEKEPAFNFPMVDDSEFTDENYGLKVTEIEEIREKKEPKKKKSKKKEEPVLYQSTKEDYVKYAESEYGGYGKGRDRKVFKPSPNISPVYGIIGDDSDYSSEIPEREVRLTSALRSDKINLDDVRKKAYGDVDTEEEPKEEPLEIEESIDLREDAPKVNKVTMGDAEEYFQDLGLEYNNDYIDIKKEKENGKLDDTEEVEASEELPAFLQEKTEEKVEIKDDKVETKEPETETELDDDNLFDLIDSMYDK